MISKASFYDYRYAWSTVGFGAVPHNNQPVLHLPLVMMFGCCRRGCFVQATSDFTIVFSHLHLVKRAINLEHGSATIPQHRKICATNKHIGLPIETLGILGRSFLLKAAKYSSSFNGQASF